MQPNHEYQQTASKWLTSDFENSISLHIGDDTNMKSWLMCVLTTYGTWLRKGEVIVWRHGIMLGFMDLRRPKVYRLVIVKIMTCDKKFPPPNKYKNQISPRPPDQHWSDINRWLIDLSWSLGETGAGSPSRGGLGRREVDDSPRTTARRSQQQLGKKYRDWVVVFSNKSSLTWRRCVHVG